MRRGGSSAWERPVPLHRQTAASHHRACAAGCTAQVESAALTKPPTPCARLPGRCSFTGADWALRTQPRDGPARRVAEAYRGQARGPYWNLPRRAGLHCAPLMATPASLLRRRCAICLFQRPGNIRQMEWAGLTSTKPWLTFPSQDMKRRLAQKINGRPHFCAPGPGKAVAILKNLQPLTGTWPLCVPQPAHGAGHERTR